MASHLTVFTAKRGMKGTVALPPGREVGTHTFRHSYARQLLMNVIPINFLSRWLGHTSIQTTPIYLELVPDPSGSPVVP